MADLEEKVGYRANAEFDGNACGQDNVLTVFAERTNDMAALGLYGGDAYPAVYECERKGGGMAGFIIAADGVGQGSYDHPSLQRFLDNMPALDPKSGGVTRDDQKLALFLRKLYGADIFKDEDAFNYAMRCFSKVPADGFYASNSAIWNNAKNAQPELPFYMRDSQSLGSRIVCVGVFYKFRKYFESGKEITEKEVESLRDQIQKYIYNELGANIKDVFDLDDATTNDKRDRYFLPSTVAMWFYTTQKDGAVTAVALNMGDARCYLADVNNGVRQISIDDAFPNGNMRAFVHFGKTQKRDEGFSDGLFRARIIHAKPPCALFACSDGVYDTCPEVKDGTHFGNVNAEPSDFLFEKNLLDAMRRCYGMHDFTREIVFNFYAQSKCAPEAPEALETSCNTSYSHVKRDDSGTLSARFFGETPTALFDALRKNTDTTLDALYELVKRNRQIPYNPPQVEEKSEREDAEWAAIASALINGSTESELLKLYPAAFASMQKAVELNGGSFDGITLWGIEHKHETPLAGFNLKQFFKQYNNKLAIAKRMIQDFADCNGGQNAEWSEHEHVIVSQEIFAMLKNAGIETHIKGQMDKGGSDADKQLALYKLFEESFFGPEPEPREKVQNWDLQATIRKVVTDGDAEKVLASFAPKPEPAVQQREPSQAAPQPPQRQQTDLNRNARREYVAGVTPPTTEGKTNNTTKPGDTE